MSSRTKLIAGTAVVAVLAAGGAAFAAVKLTTTSHTVTVTEPAPFGDGVGSYGLGGGRLGGRGFGGGLGPGPGPEGGPGLGFRRFFGPGLAAAATYLGLSPAKLHSWIQSGQTLAQIAKGQGKSLDGLVAAMISQLRKGLDAAVSNGVVTQAQADRIASRLEVRLKEMANGARPPAVLGSHA
jgi:hypothetical protein